MQGHRHSTEPFEGAQFAIAKKDERSADGVRYVVFCESREVAEVAMSMTGATAPRSDYSIVPLKEPAHV